MDIQELLHPLEGARPCGEDLMFSSTFDQIRDARRFDDPSLAQGEWVTAVKEADWSGVLQLCSDLLLSQTKDLRLGAWITEALIRKADVSGFQAGFNLLTGLCENFWEGIHPLPENGDFEARIGVFNWLIHTTSHLIPSLPLTHSAEASFTSNDFEYARTLALNVERTPSESAVLLASARLTMEQFERSRQQTPADFYRRTMEDAEQADAAIRKLQTKLDELLGTDSPNFTKLFETLSDYRLRIRRYAEDAGVLVEHQSREQENAGSDEIASSSSAKNRKTIRGPIVSREQAVVQLKEIAAFFRRTEPHSPVAYLAEKAANWSTLPLHEWLRIVVKDNGTLVQIEELLGVHDRSATHD